MVTTFVGSAIVSALVGALLAVTVTVGAVNVAASERPEPVQKPLIQYGER
jgi:hypothetical protein